MFSLFPLRFLLAQLYDHLMRYEQFDSGNRDMLQVPVA